MIAALLILGFLVTGWMLIRATQLLFTKRPDKYWLVCMWLWGVAVITCLIKGMVS